MFLRATVNKNPNLIETAVLLHRKGIIEPDTYVLDLDSILNNGKLIREEADKYGIKTYFMTKQFGRNSYIAKEFMKLGYEGAVTVDFREAKLLGNSGIKLAHVGHLVQIPDKSIEEILKLRPDYITVYSIEKAKRISELSLKLGIKQKIMLRVIDNGDVLYPAQYGGFYVDELSKSVKKILNFNGVEIKGITSFPCFLYNEKSEKIEETHNIETVKKAKFIIENIGIRIEEMNMPSANCAESIKLVEENGGTSIEPGHGLTGTTPMHAAVKNCVETPAMVYVSEISHNLGRSSFCYGGGHYRRSHMKEALVLENSHSKYLKVKKPDDESIDYYFELEGNAEVGSTVIMAYRTQIFVTRSNVAVVKGISKGKPEVIGIYDSLGKIIGR
ncbi:amino acid racemase [Clostridium sp. DMHC 10]|uniref:YhfX family PLP-dependent enzyme n=1 Tax=Clostridium sp. DMHC 10 TaxID=747377 RepID=UPI00069E68DB|nr:YhfX family PLP-dependent enzyme [Clostridium sp. DMHC 10]KOF58002.1 amino acid racemase [Clostridium sp. DMHC 10]